MNKSLLAHFAAATAALSAGTALVATRYVVGETDPISLAFYRYFIGAVCFLPLLFFVWPKHRVSATDFGKIALLGILAFCLFTLGFNASLEYIPAARGAVGLATVPIQTLIIAAIFGREVLTFRKVLAVIIAFIGIAVVFGPEAMNVTTSNYFIGDVLMLAGVFCGSLYSVFSRSSIQKHGPMFVTPIAMMFGALALFILMMINGTVQGFPTFSTKGWIAVIFLGTFAGAIQFGLFTWALKWISPTTAGLYITLSPIAAVVLGILLIGESVTLVLVVGLALVLLAILLGSGALSQLWGLIRLPRDK